MKIVPGTGTRAAMVLVFLLLASGCGSLEKVTARFHQEKHYAHTVKWPGETLSLISRWYTGSGENWRVLARANPDLVPDRIRIGETIRIPESIMERKSPLPKEFLPSRNPLPQNRAAPARAGSGQEMPELFGPKPFPSTP